MITNELTFYRPTSLDDVLSLLEEHGDDAKLLAGGMSMMPMMTLGMLSPDALISLNHVEGLAYVKENADAISIGGVTRHVDIAESPLVQAHAPLLADAARLIGDVQVRNRGTIGGSVSHADPAANYPSALLALDASVELTSKRGIRMLPIREFFLDVMTTDLRPGEMLTAVNIPKREKGSGQAYQKFTRVTGNFPIVCAAAHVAADQRSGQLAIGGVSRAPVAFEIATVLQVESGARKQALAKIIDEEITDPLADLNGATDYKREMAIVFGLKAITQAVERIGK